LKDKDYKATPEWNNSLEIVNIPAEQFQSEAELLLSTCCGTAFSALPAICEL
jgi:hypothetical protein